jgi:hypothetical protein
MVVYDDGDMQFYMEQQAKTALSHAVTNEDPDTMSWNITHDLYLALRGGNSRFQIFNGQVCSAF